VNISSIFLSISLIILSSCAEMAMLDKIKKDSDPSLISSKNNRSNIETVTKNRIFQCADKVVDGEVYNCTKYKYRIPSILVTRKDTVLAFANRRKESLRKSNTPAFIGDWNHETDIEVMRSTDKGKTWRSPLVIASEEGVNIHGGPVVLDKRTNIIYSFMRYEPSVHSIFGQKPIEYAHGTSLLQMREDKMGDHVSYSTDDGRTWSKPKKIYLPYPKDAYGAGVGNGSHGIQLSNNRVVIQARYKLNGNDHRILFYSDATNLDKGPAWKHGAVIRRKGINMSTQEFTIAESPKNVVLANFRTGQKTGQGRVQARVANATEVIEDPHHVPALNAATVHASLIKAPKGFNTYYFTIPGADSTPGGGPKREQRKSLKLYRSVDGTKTWKEISIHKSYKYAAYSDMGVFKDGSIALMFESGVEENYEFMVFKHLKVPVQQPTP
jgi:Neuraminidase (sialidase)